MKKQSMESVEPPKSLDLVEQMHGQIEDQEGGSMC